MDNSKIYIYGKEVVTPYYLNEAVADKATKAYVDESIANIEAGDVDLTNYYTKEETEAYVTEAIADVEAGDVNLTNYYTKNEVDEKIEEAEKWLAGKRFHFADSMDSIDNIQALVLEAKEVGWENIVLVVCGGFVEQLHGLYTVTDTVLITTEEGKNSGDITFTMLHPGKGSFDTEYAVFNDKGYNEITVNEQTIILTIENDMLADMKYPTTNEKLIAHYLPTNATSDTPAYMPTVAAKPASKGYVDSLNPIIFLDGTTETTLAVDIREKIFPLLKDETVVKYPMFYVYPSDSEFNVGVAKIENVADDHFVLKSIDENMRVERAASNSWIIPSTTYLWVDHDYINVRDIRKQTGQNGGPALVLETGTQYTEPYTPTYDGSPATKKYVDDMIANAATGDIDLTNYYTKEEIDEELQTTILGLPIVDVPTEYNGLPQFIAENVIAKGLADGWDSFYLKFNGMETPESDYYKGYYKFEELYDISEENEFKTIYFYKISGPEFEPVSRGEAGVTDINSMNPAIALYLNENNELQNYGMVHTSKAAAHGISVLQTDYDYRVPYEPQYDGSPATKKYVDDAVAGIEPSDGAILWDGDHTTEEAITLFQKMWDAHENGEALPDVRIWDEYKIIQYRLFNVSNLFGSKVAAFACVNTTLNAIINRRVYYFTVTDGIVTSVNEPQQTVHAVLPEYNADNTNGVLRANNTTEFTPTDDYNPATKKYVDDIIAQSGGGTDTIVITIKTDSKASIISQLQEKVYPLIQSSEISNEKIMINFSKGTLTSYYSVSGIFYVGSVDSNRFKLYSHIREFDAEEKTDGNYCCTLLEDIAQVVVCETTNGTITDLKLDQSSSSKGYFLQINPTYYSESKPFMATKSYQPTTKAYVDNAITTAVGNITSFSLMPVEVLPTENIQTNVIYLLPSENPEEENVRVEYVYINGAWEKIGTTEIDLSNYYTKTEVNTRINNAVKVLPTKDYVDGKVETAIQGLTGEELNSSLNNGQLNVGDSITCTQDYLGKYEQGNIYLVQEKERGEVSIVQQLQDLGFNVSISSRLLANDIKYFYIVEYGDEGDMYCAYSKVPLNVSGSKFPSDGWKTFSVRKMNDSDPNFYYAKYDTNKNLSSMTELTSSTNDGKYWASQFSSDVVATYTNDPAAASLYTPYVVDPTELVKYTINITPKTDLSNYMLKTEVEANYYSKEEIDAKFAEIMTILPVASQEEVQDILNGEVSE